MSPIGPGTSGCNRLQLSDTVNEPVTRLQFFLLDNTVHGAQISTSTRTGDIGDVDFATSNIEYTFTSKTPLVGLYGYATATSIAGIGVIRFDIDCQIQFEKDQERKILEDIAVQKKKEEDDKES